MLPQTTTVRVPAHECERGRGHVDVNAARWQGPPGSTAIVCVHGLGGSHVNWMLLGPLLGRHATVWAPDLAGFGRTARTGRSAGVEGNLDLVRGFVRTVSPGRPVVLAGHSLGGLISCGVAGRAPQLVAGLVLMAPALPPELGWPEPAIVARYLLATMPGLGETWLRRQERWLTPAEQVRESLQRATGDPDRVDQAYVRAQVRLLTERRRTRDARGALLAATRTMITRLGPARRRLWADVAAIGAPTLVLHGGRDRLVAGGTIAAVRARRPDWRHLAYDDIGHLPMVEDPARVAGDLVAWLHESVDQPASGRPRTSA